jgi:hypothetical protein
MKFLLLFAMLSCSSLNKTPEHKLVKVGTKLNTYRESQAAAIDTKKPVTKDTFKVTCMPVGKRIKKLKMQKGITVKQASHKNRNPKNAVPEKFKQYYDQFLSNPKLDHMLVKVDNKEYALKRIPYVESCSACHGDFNSRPTFVKKKYSQDKAHSFKAGDLRGIYIISDK